MEKFPSRLYMIVRRNNRGWKYMFTTIGVIIFLTALFRYLLVKASNDAIKQEDYIDKELRDLKERYK